MVNDNRGKIDSSDLTVHYAIVGVICTVSILSILIQILPTHSYTTYAQKGNETTTILSTNVTSPNSTLVEFVSNIEQVKGHIEQALANKQAGNNTLALAHTLHPIAEIYANIE